jgi:hypothetical protein
MKGEEIIESITTRLFETGQIVSTRGVFEKMQEYPHLAQFVNESLQRHIKGDWGNVCDEDKQENELSLKEGYRLLSAYVTKDLPKIWIITEADRSATTILFPDEY